MRKLKAESETLRRAIDSFKFGIDLRDQRTRSQVPSPYLLVEGVLV